MRLPVNRLLPLAAPIFLAGCLGGGSGDLRSVAAAPSNGPEADYPVVVGSAFTIGSTTYTPEDKLNYDAVGYAAVGQGDGTRVAASHKTLPLPSYVELTELVNGRTALVRVETRGPMRNDILMELTPAAAAQLGITTATTPVRVRRVNPPEADRAKLRAGEQAPLRIDTPKPLVAVLKRKLDSEQPALALAGPTLASSATPRPAIASAERDSNGVQTPPPESQPAPVAKPAPQVPSVSQSTPVLKAVSKPAAVTPKPAAPQASAAKKIGNRAVQVGAFSTRERAETAAKPLGGSITQSGKFWVVRMGPFNSAGDAAAALEKAKKSGYRDAIVRRID